MRRLLFYIVVCFLTIFLISCVSMPTIEKNRNLTISGCSINEQDFGGCERWYAVDKYNYDDLIEKVRFQVGYFKENNIGFILFDDGTVGEEAFFSRAGLNLRWDWGSNERDGSTYYRYSFVIEPDGTGLYYDFSISDDGVAKPRGFYKCKKF